MEYNVILTYIIAVCTIVSIPGPNIILIVNDSVTYGSRAGVLTILGIKTGMVLLFTFSLTGIVAVLSAYSYLFFIMKGVGALYILYLGSSQIYNSFSTAMEKDDRQPSLDHNHYIKGLLISVTNPKGLIFAGAFFPQFFTPGVSLTYQALILCALFLLVSFIIEMIYVYGCRLFNNWFRSRHTKRNINRISGGILIVFAILLLFSNMGSIEYLGQV